MTDISMREVNRKVSPDNPYEDLENLSQHHSQYQDLQISQHRSNTTSTTKNDKKWFSHMQVILIMLFLSVNTVFLLANTVALSLIKTKKKTETNTVLDICNNNKIKLSDPSVFLEPVVELNIKDPNTKCPSNLTLCFINGLRTCVFHDYSGCPSVLFPVGKNYTKIIGKIKAYQFGVTNSFQMYRRGNHTIDEAYVDGISLTYGLPRQHIWTFAADLSRNRSYCPCSGRNGIEVPQYVGTDYFCDTGEAQANTLATNSPLWDGRECDGSYGCCSYNSPPWFYKQLPYPTSEPIELRVCTDQNKLNENIVIEVIAIYIFN